MAYREMHQGAVRKRQQGFGTALPFRAWLAVVAVLIHRIIHRLGEIAFQLDRSDRNTVEEKHQINRVLVMQRISQLTHDAQAVGGVSDENIRIHRQGRFELGQCQRLAQANHFNAMP